MKSNYIFLMLLFGVLLSFSCKKNEAGRSSQVDFSESESLPVSSIVEPGYVLRVNSGFYSKIENDTGSEDDRTKWLAAMSLGDRVLTGNVRRITFDGDGRKYDFIEIRRENGDEGFALAPHIAVGGHLAVVTNEMANLYRSPRAVDVSGVTIPNKMIIVYAPETEGGGFVQISGFDPERRENINPNNNYVRVSAISKKPSDIQSSILLQTAQALSDTASNRVRKAAMLESAILDYPDSVFYVEILELVNPGAAGTAGTVGLNERLFATRSDVEVRDIPDLTTGRVINRLREGEAVSVTEITATDTEIGGVSAPWYRISSPSNGWVFGGYLRY